MLIVFTTIVAIPSVWLEGLLLRRLEPDPPKWLAWGGTVVGSILSHVAVYAFYFAYGRP